MKHFKIFLPIFFLAICTFHVSAKKVKTDKEAPVYAFGIATSFLDTVMYVTPVQVLENALITKDGFLDNRSAYSLELKSHVEKTYSKSEFLSVIFFSQKKKEIDKAFSKVRSKYSDTNLSLKDIPSSEFSFYNPE